MADNSQAAAIRQALRDKIRQLASIDGASLARTSELGTTLDFSSCVPAFIGTARLFGRLQGADLDDLPIPLLTQLQQAATQLSNLVEQIIEFDPARPNPVNERDALVQRFNQQYDSVFKIAAPILAYASRGDSELDELREQAESILSELRNLMDQTRQEREKVLDETKSILAHVQETAAQAGVAQHAGLFKKEADRHSKARWWWLLATAFFGGLLLVFGYKSVEYYATHPIDMQVAQAIQLGIAKLVVFGVLSFALVWASRMYRAEAHNFVVNQHRQNALATFETFVKAATDEQTKNAVLLQATRSIFSHQSSGFTYPDQEGPASPQILEIIRGILPGHGQN